MSTSAQRLAPGAYRFTARTTEEAVAQIREKLGPNARVLSVKTVPASGLKRLFASPRLEVIAQVDGDGPSLNLVSGEAAMPASSEVPAQPKSRLVQLPPSLGLAGLLRRSGITDTALERLQSGANWNELNSLPLHRALAETSRLLHDQVDARSPRPPISRAAFLGAAGVGRSTALCKWLSTEVFRRARMGHVVTVEFERANSVGPLPVMAEALGVPVGHYPCQTRPTMPGGFVYCDLPAISARRPADNEALRAWLEREQITERVLVLNAAYDRASLRDAYAAGRDLGATHLVFTHLDEVPQWGKLWDYLFDQDIEPLFLSTGPSLTDDCEEDVPRAIMHRTLPDDAT